MASNHSFIQGGVSTLPFFLSLKQEYPSFYLWTCWLKI